MKKIFMLTLNWKMTMLRMSTMKTNMLNRLKDLIGPSNKYMWDMPMA
jgi:hypothetical protein